MNKLLVNYKDVVVYQSDLNLLKNDWLNDQILAFQMTRLSDKMMMDNTSSVDTLQMVFLDPSVCSFFMHQLDLNDDEGEIMNLCRSWGIITSSTEKIVLLMIPINDQHSESSSPWGNYSSYGQQAGGYHWSLLCVSVLLKAKNNEKAASPCHQMYFHFDSSGSTNSGSAQSVANKLQNIISIGIGCMKKKDQSMIQIINCDTPQQHNGSDCGIYVLCFAEAISKHIIESPKVSMDQFILQDLADSKLWMGDILKTFVNEQYNGSTQMMAESVRSRIATDIKELSTKGRVYE